MSSRAKKRRYRLQPSAIVRLFSRFRSHIGAHRRKLAGAGICMLGATALEILRPWPIKVIFDGILVPQDKPGEIITFLTTITATQNGLLAMMALSILAIAAIGGLFSFGQAYLLSSVGQKVVASIRQHLYSHIQRLSQSFHDERGAGELLERLTGDVRMMRDLLVNSAVFLLARSLVVVGTVAIMMLMDMQLTLVALAVLPVLALAASKFGSQIKNAARRQRRKESKIAHVMAESISAIKVVRAYAREVYEDERFAKQNNASAKAGLVATRLEANLDRVIQIILAFGTCIVIWYGVLRVQAGALTPGDLLVFTAYLAGLYKPVRKLAALTGRISKATVCGERILAILELEPEIQDSEDAVDAPEFSGNINFKDVHFSYGRGIEIMSGISIDIAAGQTIAFVSKSGSGKTTFANLLLRFYGPDHGAVLIDGQDIRTYTLNSLRDQIAIVLQDSVLFNTTIRENIAYGKLDASSEEITEAAIAANAHDFIEQLPDGYDTVVGDRGAMLSGGERQRIAIARAFVRNAPILILDEPLTGLDTGAERLVRTALRNLAKGKTCLLITHDPENTLLADRVVEISEGKLTEISRPTDREPAALNFERV